MGKNNIPEGSGIGKGRERGRISFENNTKVSLMCLSHVCQEERPAPEALQVYSADPPPAQCRA